MGNSTIRKACDEANARNEDILKLPPFEEIEEKMFDFVMQHSLKGRRVIFDHLQEAIPLCQVRLNRKR